MGVRISILLPVLMMLFALYTGQAEAARFSGAYLNNICGVNDQGQEISAGAHAACQSYISGVVDYHNMLRSMKIAPEIDICVPEHVTLNEMHLQVVRYLKANPQHDGFVAAPAILLALYDQYPCSGKKRK